MRFIAPMKLSVLALGFALASCVARPAETPRLAPLRPTTASPQLSPAPPPVASNDWTDWPVTPGDWRYATEAGGSTASFGPTGAAPLLTIHCDSATRRILFVRSGGATGGALTIRTSFGAVQWPATASTTGLVAARAASDEALDQIAFSRGRFVVETVGAAPLVLPVWAEVTKVVEDCRG